MGSETKSRLRPSLDLDTMSVLEQIGRPLGTHPSANPDVFFIEGSSEQGAGLACFASKPLENGQVVLRAQDPVASTVVAKFRKEVCAWCFHYTFGDILKFKLETPRRRGAAWFCSTSCRDNWRKLIGDVGWTAIAAFEDGLARSSKSGVSNTEDETCSLQDIETAWDNALKSGEKILATRRTKPRWVPPTATLTHDVDLDEARFSLSAFISFHNHPHTYDQVKRLVPTLKLYTDSRATLQGHIDIYLYMLSVLPLDSPIMRYVTPLHMVTVFTRDSGNSWGIWGLELAEELFAYCMYPTASYFNHSCAPNLSKERIGREYVFKAAREIPEKAELNVSYLGGAEKTLGFRERQERLLKGWFFICHCHKCRIESEEISDPRAYKMYSLDSATAV